MMDRSAAPWGGREPGIGGDLPAVAEAPEERLQPESGGEFGTDAREPRQNRRRSRPFFLGEQGVARRLDGLDLAEQQLQSIQIARDLRLDVGRQRLAEPGAQVLKTRAPVAP